MSALLLVLLSVAALLCAFKLVIAKNDPPSRFYTDDRESNAVHLLMNGTMALMLTPLYDIKIRVAVIFTYWLAVVVLAVRISIAYRAKNASASNRNYSIASGGYHLFSIVAMIYAIYRMPVTTAADMKTMYMPVVPGYASMILGGIFLCDAIIFVVMIFGFPQMLMTAMSDVGSAGRLGKRAGNGLDSSTIAELRISGLPHIVMDVGMAAMLFMLV